MLFGLIEFLNIIKIVKKIFDLFIKLVKISSLFILSFVFRWEVFEIWKVNIVKFINMGLF